MERMLWLTLSSVQNWSPGDKLFTRLVSELSTKINKIFLVAVVSYGTHLSETCMKNESSPSDLTSTVRPAVHLAPAQSIDALEKINFDCEPIWFDCFDATADVMLGTSKYNATWFRCTVWIYTITQSIILDYGLHPKKVVASCFMWNKPTPS